MREVRGSIPCDSTFLRIFPGKRVLFFFWVFSGKTVMKERLLYTLRARGSQVHAALVRGHHVLDVDERVFPSVALEELQRLQHELADVAPLPLRVVDAVAQVDVLVLEDVEDVQDLAVLRHQRLAHQLGAHDHLLQELQDDAHDARVSRVERRLDRDDELRDDR